MATPPDGTTGDGTGPFSFAAAVARYETPLLRYAGQILGDDRAAAEDVVQETFVRFHRQLLRHGVAGVRNLPVWLFRVTHNLALDAIRSRTRQTRAAAGEIPNPHTQNPTAPADGELEGLINREACERAVEELRRLPEDQRTVVALRVMEGLTLAEIAQVTGMTTGGVDYKIGLGIREMARRLRRGETI